MYNGHEITSESADWYSFDNDTAKNVMIFGVGKSSSSHSDNRKNNILILGEGPTFGINEKKLILKMLTFQLNIVTEVFIIDLMLLSLEKYL